MTKLSTRKSQIENFEGFSIQIFDGHGNAASLDTQGLPEYGYKKKAPGTMTVIGWKNRFQQIYPGYVCDVLHKDDSVAHGNTQLNKIR